MGGRAVTAAEAMFAWSDVVIILGAGTLFVVFCWVVVRNGGVQVDFKETPPPTWTYERTERTEPDQ